MAAFLPPLRYRFLTRFYDAVVRITTRERTVKDELVRRANMRTGERALDLGCGTGTLSVALALAYRDGSVTGIDADVEALSFAQNKARTRGVLVNLEHGLAQQLPFEDATFDIVVSSLFYHHLNRHGKRQALSEALRVTKPGGRFLVADWGKPNGAASRLLFLPVQVLDGFATTHDNVAGFLPVMIREAGFDNIREVRAIATPLGLIRIVEAQRAGATTAPSPSKKSVVLAELPVA